MILLIHGETSWTMAMDKYMFWHKKPNSYPVLVCFEPLEIVDGDDPLQEDVALIYPAQALKLISSCTPEQLKELDGLTLAKVAGLLAPWAKGLGGIHMPPMIESIKTIVPLTQIPQFKIEVHPLTGEPMEV